MSVWICLVCASLLSCAGQLCQKQATRPSRRGRRSRHILFWLGMALLCLGCGMLLWLSVLQSIPVSIAYPMLSPEESPDDLQINHQIRVEAHLVA
ncbi:SMR family multidrug resistance protein [Klebsiella pneumoniae]|nr:SMR family multidrug resistance protein [Klebsiella pneumoniae]